MRWSAPGEEGVELAFEVDDRVAGDVDGDEGDVVRSPGVPGATITRDG